MSDTKQITYFNSLKGIAIILIIMMHCGSSSLPGIFGVIGGSFGTAGASAFLLISSFLTFSSLERTDYSNNGIFKWYINKYVRLFPMYYLAVIFAMLFGTYSIYWLGNEGRVTVGNLIAHALFVHDLFPHYANSILSVEWYLGVLAIYYLIAPVLFKFIDSLEKSVVALLISIIVCPVLNMIVYRLMPVQSDPAIYDAYKSLFSPIYQFPLFMLGITLFFLMKLIKPELVQNKKVLSVSFIVFSLFMLLGQAMGDNMLFHVSDRFLFGTWFGMILVALSIHNSILFDNCIFRSIGKYSFVMYLFQYIVISLYDRYCIFDGAQNFMLKTVIISGVLYILSILLTNFVDRPIQGRLKYATCGKNK